MMIGSLIRAAILILLASVVGVVVNLASNARVTYGGLLRFGAVGITLSVYLSVGLELADIHVPFWFMCALLLTSAYVAFGTIVSIPPVIDIRVDDLDDRDLPMDDWKPREPSTGIKTSPDY
jgi:hypothetical protein